MSPAHTPHKRTHTCLAEYMCGVTTSICLVFTGNGETESHLAPNLSFGHPVFARFLNMLVGILTFPPPPPQPPCVYQKQSWRGGGGGGGGTRQTTGDRPALRFGRRVGRPSQAGSETTQEGANRRGARCAGAGEGRRSPGEQRWGWVQLFAGCYEQGGPGLRQASGCVKQPVRLLSQGGGVLMCRNR